jgi:Uma2 family endonuclease
MSTAPERQPISVEEYLRGELNSQVKHEYLGGFIYARAGGRNAHNQIASNILSSLGARLRGKPCQPFNSNTKIRVKLPAHVRFYYPDVSVVCDRNPPTDTFQDRPIVIAEVLSRSTRRDDQTEKKETYLTIPTLYAYLLIEQDFPEVSLYRRTDRGFVFETYSDLGAIIPLAEIEAEMPMAEVYERIEFLPEPQSEEL